LCTVISRQVLMADWLAVESFSKVVATAMNACIEARDSLDADTGHPLFTSQ